MQILDAKRDPEIVVTKRVIYRHHDDVMVISAGLNYSDMMRTRSAPPSIDVALAAAIVEFENEDKARSLQTDDGLVITREMLDEFEDSSTEEAETKKEEKSMELKSEVVVDVTDLQNEKTDLVEEDKGSIDRLVLNSIEAISIEIKEEVRLNLEFTPEDLEEISSIFEEKAETKTDVELGAESVIINAENVETTVNIPAEVKEPVKIYVPPYLDPNNAVGDLVNSADELEEGEIIVDDSGAIQKEPVKLFVPSFLKDGNESVSIKSKHQPRTSILTPSGGSRKYSISSILASKERKQVHLRIDRSIFKKNGSRIVRGSKGSSKSGRSISSRSGRGSSQQNNGMFGSKQRQPHISQYGGSKGTVNVAVESALSNLTMIDAFRLEMNRVTIKTVNDSIKMMDELVIKTQDEMEEIVKILFEKVIGVSIFMDAYFKLIKSAHKTFRSVEEKEKIENNPKSDKTTYFFSRLCQLCKEEFINRESWSYDMGVQNLEDLTKEERFSYEDALEWNEVLKNKKKQRVMGCIKFISRLYEDDLINETLIILVAKDLIAKSDDGENIETLCVLLKECGKKFREKGKKIFDEVLEGIKAMQDNVDNRIRFKILDLYKKIEEWDKAKARELEFKMSQNRWYSIVNNANIDKEEDKRLKDEATENRAELEKIVKTILIDVLESDYSNENIIKRIDNYLLRFSTKEFLEVYLLEVLEQRGNVDKKIVFFIEFLGNKKMYLKETLNTANDILSDLVYDAPHCYKQFAEVLCILGVNSLISREEIISYENEEMLEVRKKYVKTLIEAKNVEAINKIADKAEANDVFDKMILKEDAEKFDIVIDYFKGS